MRLFYSFDELDVRAAKTRIVLATVFSVLLLALSGCNTTRDPFERISFGDSAVFTIFGDSMKPTYDPGDHVVTERVSFEELKPRDVVAFWYADSALGPTYRVIHRIYSIDHNRNILVARGDNASSQDQWAIPARDVIGRVKVRISHRVEEKPYDFSTWEELVSRDP